MDTASSCALERAGRWFLESGIQEPAGGVARYYRPDLAANAKISTEITGYAVSTLAYLFRCTGEAAYLDAALRAGRFLTRMAWDRAARTFPFEYCTNGSAPPAMAYFFDCGIIARGLAALWRITREDEFLDCAVQCAESMARDFPSGQVPHPVLLLPSKQPVPWECRWSRSPGCYQLKSALAWREVAEAAGCEAFTAHYERLLEYALETHASFLPGDASRERVMDRLHAYSYFLEALLPCADRPECAQALAEGIARAGKLLVEIGPAFERSDVNAQLLRVRLFAAELGAVALDESSAAREAGRVSAYQMDSPDIRIDGGFAFGRKGTDMLPYINPVSTGFALQALRMWSEFQNGGFAADWRTLI